MDQGESKLIWKRKDGREGKTTDDGRAEKAKRAVRKKWDGGRERKQGGFPRLLVLVPHRLVRGIQNPDQRLLIYNVLTFESLFSLSQKLTTTEGGRESQPIGGRVRVRLEIII